MYIYRGKLDWLNWAKNEELTIIFPESIHLNAPVIAFWQWTKPGASKEGVVIQGTVDSELVTTSNFRLGILSDQEYSFELRGTKAGDEITPLMRSGEQEVTLPPMKQVYGVAPPRDSYLGNPVPRIYVGKMNWSRYSLGEQFIVVLPGHIEKDSPIACFWLWSLTHTGSHMVNVNHVGSIASVSLLNGVKNITFGIGDPVFYTLRATVDEDGDSLTVTMTNPGGGDSGPLPLNLLGWASAHAELLAKRGATTVTSTVKNDTPEAVICTLQESGSPTLGPAQEHIALLMTLLGANPWCLGPEHSSASPPKPDAIIAGTLGQGDGVSSALVAAEVVGTGLYDATQLPSDTIVRVLLPGEEMTRTTSGARPYLGSNNEAILWKLSIDPNDQRRLRCTTVTAGALGEDTFTVSNLLMKDPKDALTLVFREPRQLQLCLLITLRGAYPVSVPPSPLPELGAMNVLPMHTNECFSTGSTGEGVMDDVILFVPSKGEKVLDFVDGEMTHLTYDTTIASNRQYDLLRLPGSPMVVVKIKQCVVTGGSTTPLKTVATEDDVLRQIAVNAGYMVYSWHDSTREHKAGVVYAHVVDGSSGGSSDGITATDDDKDCVYLPITGLAPCLRLVDPGSRSQARARPGA